MEVGGGVCYTAKTVVLKQERLIKTAGRVWVLSVHREWLTLGAGTRRSRRARGIHRDWDGGLEPEGGAEGRGLLLHLCGPG